MMTPQEIKQQFAQSCQSHEQEWEKNGVAACLEKLSTIIGDIQDCGIDISLHISSKPSAVSFELSEDLRQGSSIVVSGYIKIGTLKHLFSLATRLQDKPVNKIFISLRDSASHVSNHGYVSKGFDFKEKSEILRFQELLVSMAARQNTLTKYDSRHVFNKSPVPLKTFGLAKSVKPKK